MSKHKSLSELDTLKVTIKNWEKHFYTKNGRKPTKTDIDSDNDIKYDYKKYWNSIKKSNLSQVWNRSLNKSKTADNPALNSQDSVLNTFSKKMFDNFLKTTNDGKQTEGQFSLKKRLLKRRQQSIDNQKSRQNAEQCAVQTDTSITTTATKLNPVLIRALSIDESISRSISAEFNTNNNNFNKQSNEEKITFGQTLVDNNLINDIINRIDVINDKNNSESNLLCNETTDSGVGVDSRSDSLSNDSLTLNDLQMTSKTRIKRKSDVFDFDDDIEDNSSERPVKRRIYSDLESNYELNKRTVKSNANDLTEDKNESNTEPKKKKFFVNEDRDKRLSSLNAYKIKLSSIIQTDEQINEIMIQTNVKQNSKTSVENTVQNQETEETVAQKKKTSLKTKPSKTKAKKPQTNFKRLDLQRKVFASRGYRKFNVKKYKRMKWKQNVHNNRNNCYKCGAAGHWAQDCQLEDKLDSDVFEDELKSFGVSKAVEDLHQTFKVKPLFSERSEEEDCADLPLTTLTDALISMGHKTFRDNQELVIRRILSGKSSLMIASTGSGKSLCYQLPAYLYWKHRKAITLVISPLISLMEDQLTTFPKNLKAVCIHSGLSQAQRQSALDSLLSGESQVILLSPEAITGGNTVINLNALPPIAFVCIDEAHCLSEWSNNFRPSYLQLYRVLRNKLKIHTFLALTATATKKTSLTIARTLGLDPNNDIIGTTLVPENLIISVSRDSNKELALIDLLRSERFNDLKSIIIYCTRREQTERLASLIRISFQEIRQTNPKTGKSRIVWDAQAYHAGKTSEERNRVQKRFIKGDLRVIVATIAFGMGINKANIRGIIHYNLPKSFENYMQEIGRAGRDGFEAHCHLFLDSDGSDLFELQRHIFANSTDRKCLRKLIEKVFKPCKCRTIYDEEDNESDKSKNVCTGHEIAFPIESTVMELDLKEETIMTLITYLELDSGKVELLAPINSMCTLFCYGDGAVQMKIVAKQNAIVGIALTLYQKKNPTQEIPDKIKFDLVEVCSMLGRPISEVRNDLRQLEWTEVNGRKKRTNIRVMFSDLSFHVRSVGDSTEEQLNECLELMFDLTQIQESTEVSKLRNVYLTFRQYSQTYCTKRINQTKCLQLKDELNKYFNDDDIDGLSNDVNNEQFKQLFRASHVHDLEQARRDVRDLLSIHGSQTLSSARVIARILQGIASPRFPADVWGKCRRFWRSNINIDFNELLKIANEELIKIKSN